MGSADIAATVFRSLEDDDFKVLQAIETAMRKHDCVPKEQIAKLTKLSLARDTDFRLNRLNKMGLVYQKRRGHVGYTLNYAGYDCLAINALAKVGVFEAFGKPLGVGKEADVYDALDQNGKRVAVKFHRLGRTSFRQTQRKRGYTSERASWLFQSRLAAEKEFQALKLLFPRKIAVPEPISQSRHVLVMGIIDGVELAKWKRIHQSEKILKTILQNVRKTYLKAGIIHADLSEYNVILRRDKRILIIDWPQYVTLEHPNSSELLKRDVQNILQHFKRRHKIDIELDESLEYVTGRKPITIL
jgi:RIO kinase 2